MKDEFREARERVVNAIFKRTSVQDTDLMLVCKALTEIDRQRYFPVMRIGVVPWWVGREAFKQYKMVPNKGPLPQGIDTIEKVAQQGGFAAVEMDKYFPNWRAHLRPFVMTVGAAKICDEN